MATVVEQKVNNYITKAHTKGIAKGLGYVNQKVNEGIEAISPITTSYVNKLWRGAILLHRATHLPHAKISKIDPAKGNNTLINQRKRDAQEKRGRKKLDNLEKDSLDSEFITFSTEPYDNLVKEKKSSNQIILYNLTSKPYEYIVIQNRPNRLEFKGETSWAAIKSMGRNTPMYHFTGAEDVIQFNISWFCDDPDHLDEVVNKCRFLEAWTKANGYQASPPVIQIQWGTSEIFKDHYYILTSATYTLENFNDFIRINGNKRKDLKAADGKLLPSTATQELIFKRVSATNLSWNDILPEDKMKYTRGLNKP